MGRVCRLVISPLLPALVARSPTARVVGTLCHRAINQPPLVLGAQSLTAKGAGSLSPLVRRAVPIGPVVTPATLVAPVVPAVPSPAARDVGTPSPLVIRVALTGRNLAKVVDGGCHPVVEPALTGQDPARVVGSLCRIVGDPAPIGPPIPRTVEPANVSLVESVNAELTAAALSPIPSAMTRVL